MNNKKAPVLNTETLKILNKIIPILNVENKSELEIQLQLLIRDTIRARSVV